MAALPMNFVFQLRKAGEIMCLDRKGLLKELKKKYFFEKAHSIIQIAIEDGNFKNDEVDIIILDAIVEQFRLIWI